MEVSSLDHIPSISHRSAADKKSPLTMVMKTAYTNTSVMGAPSSKQGKVPRLIKKESHLHHGFVPGIVPCSWWVEPVRGKNRQAALFGKI